MFLNPVINKYDLLKYIGHTIKMIIYLIRHGHATRTDNGSILSEIGHKQAMITAKKIKQLCGKYPTKVFSSTMTRAVQTAEYFTYDIYQHKFLGEYTRSGESFLNFISRVKKCERELRTFNNSIYIIYGHAIFISALLSIITGFQPENTGDLIFRLNHCSISKISFENGSWRILGVNNTDHIPSHRITINNDIDHLTTTNDYIDRQPHTSEDIEEIEDINPVTNINVDINPVTNPEL